jgi:hypothetical protein
MECAPGSHLVSFLELSGMEELSRVKRLDRPGFLFGAETANQQNVTGVERRSLRLCPKNSTRRASRWCPRRREKRLRSHRNRPRVVRRRPVAGGDTHGLSLQAGARGAHRSGGEEFVFGNAIKFGARGSAAAGGYSSCHQHVTKNGRRGDYQIGDCK